MESGGAASSDHSGESSRTKKTARNALVGLLSQAVVVVLGFATRTIFIQQLGVELLGLHSLLVSVVAVAAIADLGVGTAVMHALYAPLRDNDHGKVAAITAYASVLYRRVAAGVMIIGLAVSPFLGSLVKLPGETPGLHLFYFAMLGGTALNFVFLSRTQLIVADQKSFWVSQTQIAFNIARSVAQIVVLIVWPSLLIFIVIQALSTIATSVFLFRLAGVRYPRARQSSTLDPPERRAVARSVRAMMIYRVSGVALNNTDALFISALVGTVSLGFYSNYLLILGASTLLLQVVFQAFTPGVGNLIVSGNPDKKRGVFLEMNILAVAAYGSVAVGLGLVLSRLVEIWLGDAYLLAQPVVFALLANFYLVGTMSPVIAFRAATGLFQETKYIVLLAAVLNVGLSWALGLAAGLLGILIATIMARALSNLWYEPLILIRRELPGVTRRYLRIHVSALVAMLGSYFCGFFLESRSGFGFATIGGTAVLGMSGVLVYLIILVSLLMGLPELRVFFLRLHHLRGR